MSENRGDDIVHSKVILQSWGFRVFSEKISRNIQFQAENLRF